MAAKQNVKIIIAAVVLILSVLFLYSFLGGFGPPVDVTPQKALGKFLATEALRMRGPGGKIFLLCQDTSGEANPYAEAQLRAFERTLGKNGGTVDARRQVRLNPIRVVGVSGAEFANLLKKSSESDVLVSFVGPPAGAEPPGNIPEKHARVLAVCSGWIPRQINLRRAFEQGMLSAAVISRPEAATASASSPLEVFHQHFTIVTAANLAELPLAAASRREK